MKRALILVLFLLTTLTFAEDARPSGTSDVIHVATALDHLTVLEFGEPVTMAAAGSNAFQIERQENMGFVKPLKPGVSTDLFVWTSSRRFAYELEPAGEVKNMNFAIDSLTPARKPVPDAHAQMTRSVVRQLGPAKRTTLQVANAETQIQDLAPGNETRGVIAVRQQFSGPTVFELVFRDAGDHNVTAVFVR